jgi:hypothetical protein
MPHPRPVASCYAAAWATLVVGAVGCQAPFGSDRHDIEADRIVAITTVNQRIRPILSIDGRLARGAEADYAWFLLPEGRDLPPADAAVSPWSVDADPPAAPGRYGLRVTFPSGAVREAVLLLQGTTPPTPTTLGFATVSLPFEPNDDEVALTAAARAAINAEPLIGAAAPGAWLRVQSNTPVEAVDRVRWMQHGPDDGVGITFLELDTTTTDLALGALTLDDLVIEESVPASPAVRTILALVLGRAGAHTLLARDVEIGLDAQPLVRWGDALLPAEQRAEGPGTATLIADDAAPLGLRAVNVTYGLDESPSLPACADGGAPLPALLDGRCTANALDGTTVAVEAP